MKRRPKWIDTSEISAINVVYCVAAQERIQNLTYIYLLFILLQRKGGQALLTSSDEWQVVVKW